MASKETWQTISLKPLTGMLDLRSRPADIPIGGYRMRQNWATSSENKLCRRQGFSRLFPDHLFDSNGDLLSDPNHSGTGSFYHNDDLHHQGSTREAITLLYENTDADGSRSLFAGTQSRVSFLNEATGYWTDIITGKGTFGSRFKCATLQDDIIFANNFDKVLGYTISSNGGAATEIADLTSLNVASAAVVVEFNGCIMLMNLVQDGARKSSRVRWSDLNNGRSYDPSAPDSVAGFKDLNYGDEILAAKEMLGSLLIYTTRSIWRCIFAGGTGENNSVFDFQRIYYEPKNQIGCLKFPNTLVSTGQDHYYASADSIYHFSPYIAAPERTDWIHRADAAMYIDTISKVDPKQCASPVAEFIPASKELWISWGSVGFSSRNNWTLVLNTDQKAADIIDTGFTALVNYRPGQSNNAACNENQLFIGASGRDWSLKQIGGVFYRELATLTDSDISQDIALASAVYFTEGYYSILRGQIPLGVPEIVKRIRRLVVDDDVREQDTPCAWRLRIGHSYKLVDPNDTDDRCTPLWVRMPDVSMECHDGGKASALLAQNLTPDTGTEFPMYEEGNYLYFELIVADADGSKAIGGDVCLTMIAFEVMALSGRK